ncbi:sugar O-acetyltransferase [Oenococcus kitaharae]|uniref:Acetyltransferase n=1 Tax=Oenococcus kitaharae DSM 17330 TaxID=1045004 RepID=G9WGG5_9LACO|nr:sugar O-acetyltransferase [Oenococcus kitaharae]EHN59792.1 galactoside O-acetyltransferase [Oenococcus kitaharae DSM 17330]OEY83611.1 acetyltransferase [Oenococcus kitaharae]OEY85409.1 acetyltransferase [Oenococcus kitaharae]OEY86262.1 acetyltransferase [Oenococcus kitaharae]
MSEQTKMLSGKLYDASDEDLAALRLTAHKINHEYNETFEDEVEKRKALLAKLVPKMGSGAYLQSPIHFDYGVFTEIGDRFFSNFNLTILDTCPVKIGNDVFLGPNITIATPMHPLRFQERNQQVNAKGQLYDYEYGKSITIGDNCWLASNVIVTAGVHIGEGCVIGAGSVVTKDIPANYLAFGNPCRPIREITDQDRLELQGKTI